LDFLPPQMEPRDICGRLGPEALPDDFTVEGDEIALTDPDRIRFLRRDIRVYAEQDADGYFDFIEALIARRGEIDADFTPVDQTFARINLWLRAGRLEGLETAGLVESLRTRVDQLGNNQRVALARFYADGTGVARDVAFAQELIREAAYGGNARALLEIARLAQNGTLIEGWDAPLDLTITMAFGGILGALDGGVCRRAEQIAQAYVDGDVVTANPALALAWFRFAADMGRAESAWRVVEFYLNADRANQDNIALRRYLEQAVRLGISVSADQQVALTNSGAVTQTELEDILGFNHSGATDRASRSLGPLFQLRVNIDGMEADEDGLVLKYLREIVEMPEAPGRIFDRLAGETLVRKGRWAGEAEATALLEEAIARGDGGAKRRLANMLMRYRDDPAQVARAESLLMEAVAAHGIPQAMRDLDRLYRCQVNDAPRLAQADVWLSNYASSGHRQVAITSTDLLALAPSRSPEAIAAIQTLALRGRPQMVASQAHRVQADPLASEAARRFWAAQVNRSDQALEAFAEIEFDLARTPAERDLAIELFRRIYLNNGVTTALDLAIALTEYNARDPQIAQEIVTLLTMAGNRGEGGAIRLLSRLQSETRSEAQVYAQFADKIEARGDFLAMMFAIPHIDAGQVDDYIDRAVSLMACGTKDADELGDAHAIRGQDALSNQWRQIGLHFEGGHVLSKLRLSNRQVAFFDDGTAPDPVAVANRRLAEGDAAARVQLIALTINPDLETYDPQAALGYMVEAFQSGPKADRAALATLYRGAPQEVQAPLAQQIDVGALLRVAADTGDTAAAYEYAMMLRAQATGPALLARSAHWLQTAAERGHTPAMYEYGYVLGFGLGLEADPKEALVWLGQAATAGHPEAAKIAQLLRLKGVSP
jgi:TPR repeat protein